METNDSDDYWMMKNMKLRNYQVKIIEDAKKQNSIVLLPTGSGKTLIAIQILCTKTSEVIGEFPEKAKRIFFVAPTKVLVYQLHKIISTHTKFKAKCYSGDMMIDFWSKEKWLEEFKANQVLVLTGEILRQILEVKFILPNQISLIVFDECHHASLAHEHPFSLILKYIGKEPTASAPLLLGLSAVLLNANPKKKAVSRIIADLKGLFRGVILTTVELNETFRFSAKPKEKIIPYKLSTSLVQNFVPLYDEIISILENLKLTPQTPKVPEHSKPYKNENKARRLKNWIDSAKKILNDCGLYSGALSILYYILRIEKHRLMTTNPDEIQVLIYCRTALHKIRHILLGVMGEETAESILKYSSNKIQTLVNLLVNYNNSVTDNFSTLIFVREKATAITVANLLRRLREINSNFSFLKPEFVIGSNVFDKDTLFHELNNEKIIKEFASQNLNTLISTNILEEGIDVTSCNLVVSFDFPRSYASYIQTKGRARDAEGSYYLMASEEDLCNCKKLLNEYTQTEKELYKVILQDRVYNNDEDNLDHEEEDPKSSTPIKAVYRYCAKLPQDKYSYLSPTAWYTEIGGKRKASVLLPVNCPIRDIIEGDVEPNCRLARKSAFLETVKKLQEIGEIDENLNPVPMGVKLKCFDHLFPHYKNELIVKNSPVPGSKKRKQIYEVKFAKSLSECLPQPGQKAYLHVIDFAFKCEKMERDDKLLVQEVLQSPVSFAILSSKKLCKICPFPLFLDVAQVDCNLLINHGEIILSKSELEDIKSCHFSVFQKVLRIIQSFQIFDNTNKGHSFYVVPVKKNELGIFELDWEIIRCDFCKESKSAIVRYNPFYNRSNKRNTYRLDRERCQTSNAMVPLSVMDDMDFWIGDKYEQLDQEPAFVMSEAEYKYFVISPNYRNIHPPQLYIVSKFCYDITPLSPFPRSVYANYCHYYEDKYMIKITNVKQPLMKVGFVFHCSNFNRPKFRGNQEKSRLNKTHDELLIPELCDVYPFDRRYWLKALLLPTALNRFYQLYCLEEFRQKIVSETGLGALELPTTAEWKPLQVDFHVSKNEKENEKEDVQELLNKALPLSQLKDNGKVDVKFIDPKRNLLEISVVDMEYIIRILGNVKCEEEMFESLLLPPRTDDALSKVKNREGFSIPPLNTIIKKESTLGPELAHLLQALTASGTNDIVNYERLEVLGDAFLKFAVTLFLFRNYKENEGVLTFLKGKLLGNRNLLYCGLAKGFQDVLNVVDFCPFSDWNPPLVCLPGKLVDAIKESNADTAVIYRWEISPEEQFSGELLDETLSKNEEIIRNFDKACNIPSSSLLPFKLIGDKTISDAVEAVIGLYLWEFGVSGGLEILMWLGVLPRSLASYSNLIGKGFVPNLLSNSAEVSVMNILSEVFYADLEETLGYQFKNKALLLEAISHPTYASNRITDCYQRLEFLGDAILDFLITSYIYEYCDDQTPGQVTDIRSALVNNVTFASLAVRYDFHKYLLKLSSRLNKAIEEFVTHQASRNYEIDDNAGVIPDKLAQVSDPNPEVLILMEENDCLIAEAVQVPKALGDIFESLAGAIYLDSGNSLETVWSIYYRLMKQEIDTFTKSAPKNPVRLLHEICEETPVFEVADVEGTTRVACTVWYDNAEIKTYGFGSNKVEAKRSAAKFAVKKISELKK